MENCLPSLKWNLFSLLLMFPVVTVECTSKNDERLRECIYIISARSLSKLKRNSLICGCWFFTQNALTHWWLMKWLLMVHMIFWLGSKMSHLNIIWDLKPFFSICLKNFSDTIPSKWKYHSNITKANPNLQFAKL